MSTNGRQKSSKQLTATIMAYYIVIIFSTYSRGGAEKNREKNIVLFMYTIKKNVNSIDTYHMQDISVDFCKMKRQINASTSPRFSRFVRASTSG